MTPKIQVTVGELPEDMRHGRPSWRRPPHGIVVQVFFPGHGGQLEEAYGPGVYAVVRIDGEAAPELGTQMKVVL